MITNIYSKKILPVLVTVLVALTVSSCTTKFEDYNTNQHEATDDMMDTDGLRVGARIRQMQRNVVMFADGDNIDSDYQIAQNLTNDIYSGFMSPTLDNNNGNHNGTYNLNEDWCRLLFIRAYLNIMQPWSKIVEEHQKNDLPNELALATIIKVLGMHRVADTYGPIPYSGFVAGSVDNDYESLEDVYRTFFAELDEAIETLTSLQLSNPEDKLLERFDMVYSGDVDKWIKLANTLRLRLAVRISYVNPTMAQEQISAVMANSHGLIANTSERASLKHDQINYTHPVYVIAYTFNSGDIRPGASLVTYMNGLEDPRRSAYFTQATATVNNNPIPDYYGVRLGIVQSNWEVYKGNRISNFNINAGSTEIVWVTAAESYFLLAELAQRGFISGNAETYYEEGIRMSFNENGVTTGVDSYIASSVSPSANPDWTGFVDNSGNSQGITGLGTSGLPTPVDFDNITVAWANDGMELARIALQKWIAIYPDGVEGWAEYRRTGMPYLYPPQTNRSNDGITDDLQIRRIPYPRDEYDTNLEKVTAAVSSYLGGPDTGATPLWWDTRN
ncbi:MAG: SusD/RagB family nutrient-binding outer membrane lipoprotein [Rikenellaceae bacterium]|nr:SusD/RagB family nutrient-binding outer membrane lipoprotein [Rikenellaceae bacterium]